MKEKYPKIPNPFRDKRLLNDKIALVPGEEEGSENFKISFDYYKSNLCEIEELQTSPARKCLSKLKQMGQSTSKNFRDNNIQSTPVQRAGNYLSLFSDLTDDVNLYEIDIGKSSRLFYFIAGSLMHVVAIKNSHIKY